MTDELAHLFKKPPHELTVDETKTILEVYKILVDMADKVSQRRQSSNSFYLSVNTALVGASAYISTSGVSANPILISLAGMAVSLLWIRNIQSYKDLNSGKFAVITRMEEALPVAPFDTEWRVLERGSASRRYRPFHKVEILVPWLFIVLHALQGAYRIPWSTVLGYISR